MKKTLLTATAIVLTAGAAGAWFYKSADASDKIEYRAAAVERGDIKATVAATGSLSAVRTVQVGTQVSGLLNAIHVDFNDRVKKGQLLARIDPTLQQQAVQDAEAQLERAKAQLAQARGEFDRNKQLFDAQIVTAAEFATVQSNQAVASANVKSAQISVDKARQNLAYTSIYAPIDGVVVERNVDVGQTVAASLSAPQLFLIANDLAEMQILASVDESDIGQIAEGMPVEFTVQSYANRTFKGTVQQVRLQSTTTNNVVSYTAVVAVKNEDGKLLPGMTATVKFVTGQAEAALTVPNAALRFRPAGVVGTRPSALGTRPAGAGAAAPAGAPAQGGPAQGALGRVPSAESRVPSGERGSRGMLFTQDATGKLTPVRVKVGITDGQRTVVEGEALTEGMKILTGVSTGAPAAAAGAPAASPFGAQQQQGARRGPPSAF